MLLITFFGGLAAASNLQLPLLRNKHNWPKVPGGSLVKLCPVSHEDDLFKISQITDSEKPYYNEGVEVLIHGNFTKQIPAASTIDWEVILTNLANETGTTSGTFNFCSYMEDLHQPPDSKTEKSCPPDTGPAVLDYIMWFARGIFPPGKWLVKFDAKTPDGERIYCLITEFDLPCLPDNEFVECRVHDASDGFDVAKLLGDTTTID